MMAENEKIDADLCMIYIDKLCNPSNTDSETAYLIRELIDVARHEELKKMLVNGIKNISEIRDQFKNKIMELNGEKMEEDTTDYVDILKKYIDPNISEVERKPFLRILMEGSLNEDQKHQVGIISNCKDPRQIADMLDDFKKSFVKVKKKKPKEKEKQAAAAAVNERDKPDYLKGSFRDLIGRMVDKDVKQSTKTQIYMRLMEPDVEFDYKNIAIKLADPQYKELDKRIALVKDFDQELKIRKEKEEAAAKRRKEEEDRRRALEVEKKRRLKEQRERMMQSRDKNMKKQEFLKKRELMMKMKEKERKIEEAEKKLMTPEQKEALRKEMYNEIKDFRQRQKADTKRKDEQRKEKKKDDRTGYILLPWKSSKINLPTVKIEVKDFSRNNNLSDTDRKLLGDLMTKVGGKRRPSRDDKVDKTSAVVEHEAQPSPLNSDNKSTTPQNGEKDKELGSGNPILTATNRPTAADESEEFWDLCAQLSAPGLTEAQETKILKDLIIGKRSALVKQLVVRLSSVSGTGNSKMFQNLCNKFVGERVYAENALPRSEDKNDGAENKNEESQEENCKASEEKVADGPDKETEASVQEKDLPNRNTSQDDNTQVSESRDKSTVLGEEPAQEDINKDSTSSKSSSRDDKAVMAPQSEVGQDSIGGEPCLPQPSTSAINPEPVEEPKSESDKENSLSKNTLASQSLQEKRRDSRDKSLKESRTKDKCVDSVDAKLEVKLNGAIQRASKDSKSVSETDKVDSKALESNSTTASASGGNNVTSLSESTRQLPNKSSGALLKKKLTTLTVPEIKERFNLKRADAYVKIKVNKLLYKAFLLSNGGQGAVAAAASHTVDNKKRKAAAESSADSSGGGGSARSTKRRKLNPLYTPADNKSSPEEACDKPRGNGLEKEGTKSRSVSKPRSVSRSKSRTNSRSRSRSVSRRLSRSRSRSGSRSMSRSVSKSISRSKSRSRSMSGRTSRSKSRNSSS